MVTVKDLKEALDKYDETTPIFWGVDFHPCWVAKENATIEDFPMKQDYRPVYKEDNKYKEITSFLYFGDYRDYEKLAQEYEGYLRDIRDRSLWDCIKYWWYSRH